MDNSAKSSLSLEERIKQRTERSERVREQGDKECQQIHARINDMNCLMNTWLRLGRREVFSEYPNVEIAINGAVDDLMTIGRLLKQFNRLDDVSKWGTQNGSSGKTAAEILCVAANDDREKVYELFTQVVLDAPVLRWDYHPDDLSSVFVQLAHSIPLALRMRWTLEANADEKPKMATPVAASLPTVSAPTPAETKQGEGGKPSAKRGGRTPLTKSKKPEDKAKLNVYELIRAVKNEYPSWGKKELHNHFKKNNEFRARVKDASLTFNEQMFHSALKWLGDNPS